MDIAEQLQQLFTRSPEARLGNGLPPDAPIRQQVFDPRVGEVGRILGRRTGSPVAVNQNGFAIAQDPAGPSIGERLTAYLNSILPSRAQVEGAVIPRVDAAAGAAERARIGAGDALNDFLRRAAERRPFEASAAER